MRILSSETSHIVTDPIYGTQTVTVTNSLDSTWISTPINISSNDTTEIRAFYVFRYDNTALTYSYDEDSLRFGTEFTYAITEDSLLSTGWGWGLESITENNMITSFVNETVKFSPNGSGGFFWNYLDPYWEDDYYTEHSRWEYTHQWEKAELPSLPQ